MLISFLAFISDHFIWQTVAHVFLTLYLKPCLLAFYFFPFLKYFLEYNFQCLFITMFFFSFSVQISIRSDDNIRLPAQLRPIINGAICGRVFHLEEEKEKEKEKEKGKEREKERKRKRKKEEKKQKLCPSRLKAEKC